MKRTHNIITFSAKFKRCGENCKGILHRDKKDLFCFHFEAKNSVENTGSNVHVCGTVREVERSFVYSVAAARGEVPESYTEDVIERTDPTMYGENVDKRSLSGGIDDDEIVLDSEELVPV